MASSTAAEEARGERGLLLGGVAEEAIHHEPPFIGATPRQPWRRPAGPVPGRSRPRPWPWRSRPGGSAPARASHGGVAPHSTAGRASRRRSTASQRGSREARRELAQVDLRTHWPSSLPRPSGSGARGGSSSGARRPGWGHRPGPTRVEEGRRQPLHSRGYSRGSGAASMGCGADGRRCALFACGTRTRLLGRPMPSDRRPAGDRAPRMSTQGSGALRESTATLRSGRHHRCRP